MSQTLQAIYAEVGPPTEVELRRAQIEEGWLRAREVDREICETAMNVAVAHVQFNLGQTDGGFASHYFDGSTPWNDMVDTMMGYLEEERAWMVEEEEEEEED